MKKGMAFLLSIIIIFNIMTPIGMSFANVNNYIVDGEAYNGNIFDNSLLINDSRVSINDIKVYLSNKGYSQLSEDGRYVLNPYVYKKYKIIAYTDQNAVDKSIAGLTTLGSETKEDYVKEGTTTEVSISEYRYLGYNNAGTTLITNDFYPMDSKTLSDATKRSWIEADPKLKSWSDLEKTNKELQNYYLRSKLLNDDEKNGIYKIQDYSVAGLTGKNDTNTLMKFPKILNSVSFESPMIFVMNHRVNGSTWYDTMRKDKFSYKLNASIESKTNIILPVSTDYYDFEYTVKTVITDMVTDGESKGGRYIETVQVNASDERTTFSNNKNLNLPLPPLTENFTKTFDLRGLKVGVKTPFTISSNSIVTTFGGAVKTKSVDQNINITLVANDTIDFTINRNETDVTGGTVVVENIANPNLTLRLEDASFVESADVTQIIWKVETTEGEITVLGGNSVTAFHTLTGANKNCIIDGVVTYIEYVFTEDTLVNRVTHKVKITENPSSTGASGGVVAVIKSTADYDEKNDRYEVMEGRAFYLKGNKSYHEEGLKIVEYAFDVGEDFDEGIMLDTYKKRAKAFYPKSDGGTIYKTYLEVTDENGARDTDRLKTKVLPAEFSPEIEITGTFKENRKLTFVVDNEYNLAYYPVDTRSIRWTITPIDGQGNAVEIDGSLNSTTFNAQFSKMGRYKVTVEGQITSIYNPNIYTGKTERIINISEDMNPIANFRVQNKYLRDVENGNLTQIEVWDDSKSIDNDLIVQRIWSYKFDTDKDGSFDDESSVIFDASNSKYSYFFVNHVHDYKIELKVKEEFGQATISRFVTDADKRRSNTDDKAINEKIVNIGNVAPTVEFEISKQRKIVNVIIYEDLTSSEKLDLESQMTILKKDLFEKKIDLKTHYIAPTESVGSKKVQRNYFDTYIKVNLHLKGLKEKDSPWASSKEYDIDEIKSLYFYLDSYIVGGTKGLDQSNAGVFQLENVGFSGGDYIKYGSKRDYREFEWKELEVDYLKNGVARSQNYNFCYDFRKYEKDDGETRDNEITYDTYDIVSTELVVDEYSPNRHVYVETNHVFTENDYLYYSNYQSVTKSQNTSGIENLMTIKESSLEEIINDCGDEETFFLNLASKEVNRLALDVDFMETLKSNDINYMTLDDYFVVTNPLSGRYDDFYLEYGDYRDPYRNYFIAVGNVIYKLLDGNYTPVALKGSESSAYTKRTVYDNFLHSPITVYTTGRSGYRGLQALNYGMDNPRVFSSRKEEEWSNARKDPNFFRTNMGNLSFHVEKDTGLLLGIAKNFEFWDYEKRTYTSYLVDRREEYKVYGTAYKGSLAHSSVKPRDFEEVSGYVKTNGTVVFNRAYNYRISGFSYGVYMTLNEKITDIDHYYMNKKTKTLYVFTNDKQYITYDMVTRKRTVLVTEYLERIGDGIRVDADTVMCDGVTFDGYKEVYTNEFAQEAEYPISHKFTLDIEGNYKVLRTHYTYYYDQSQHKSVYTKHEQEYLIAENVSSLPFRRYLFGSRIALPSTSHYTSYPSSYDQFVTNESYLCSSSEISKMIRNLTPSTNYPTPTKISEKKVKNVAFAGVYVEHTSSDHSKWYTGKNNFESIIWYQEGTLTIDKEYKYANLTVGDQGKVIGDGELTSITPTSASYESLIDLMSAIKNIYKNHSTSDSMIILLNSSVNSRILMMDYENDPLYEMRIDSEHVDPNFFENSMGRDPSGGKGINLNKFNYVGHYKLRPHVRDNPVGDDDQFDNYRLWNKDNTVVNVFVHRRPLAYFTTSISEEGGKMTLNAKDNGSYDLDHESKANKGIVKWEWSLKGEHETAWKKYYGNSFSVVSLSSNQSYFLALRVLDEEGEWSNTVTKKIESTEVPLTLTAKLKTVKKEFSPEHIPITEALEVYDIQTIYPKPILLKLGFYKNGSLVSTEQEIYFEEGATGETVDQLFGQRKWNALGHTIGQRIADGPYTLRLEAVDVSKPSKSEIIEFDVGVRTPINPIPMLNSIWITTQAESLKCSTSIYTDAVQVTLFKGSIHEDIINMQLESSNRETSEKSWTLDYVIPQNIVNGLYDIEFSGLVNTLPQKTESRVKTVQVISLGFEEVILTGAWNHWRGQEDLFGKQLVDMPYRFLSWEKIFITANTLGNPDKVLLRLSPALEAMSFEDDNGKTFYYADDFGRSINFPLEFTKEEDNVWKVSYILPLADSTLSWEDDRVRAPYKIIVRAYKDDYVRTYEFSEAEGRAIEITGNTSNLIYQQPVVDK